MLRALCPHEREVCVPGICDAWDRAESKDVRTARTIKQLFADISSTRRRATQDERWDNMDIQVLLYTIKKLRRWIFGVSYWRSTSSWP